MTAPLLTISNLDVSVPVDGVHRSIIEDLSLTIAPGEAVGLVGESGSGKSMTARSILRLHPREVQTSGSIDFDGRNVLTMDARALRAHRRKDVAMVFQDPRAAINPIRTIGDFLTEGLRRAAGVPKRDAVRRAVAAMEAVGISRPQDRLSQYPHELSGGMLQRVMICSTLLTGTRLLLADEATSALDVTTQAEVVGLLDALRRERDMGLLFITHDLDLAVALCDRVCVMYAGRIVETRPARGFAAESRHPYSKALFDARPSVDRRSVRLPAIPGTPIAAFQVGDSCGFASRCAHAVDGCRVAVPKLRPVDGGDVRCIRAEELAEVGTSRSEQER